MEHLIENLLQDFNDGKLTRRQLVQMLAFAGTAATVGSAFPVAAAEPYAIQAVALNHVGYLVADRERSAHWYADQFGMKVEIDAGDKTQVWAGESFISFHTRKSASDPPVDHICFTIANWDKGEVLAELKRRKLEVVQVGEKSIHIKDLDGFLVQLGGKTQG